MEGTATVVRIQRELESCGIEVFNLRIAESHTYFVRQQDSTALPIWVHNANYAKTFYKANPKLKGKVVVNHAIEQQVLTRYPGLFAKSEIHSLKNLRGIPGKINSEIHLGAIRKEWNRFYGKFDALGTTPSRLQIIRQARAIDAKYGSQFQPPVGG